MRVVRLLGFVALAGLASVLVTIRSAEAQGSASDPTGGSFAIRARSDGAYSPPRLVMPTLGEFRLSVQLVFARYLSPSTLPARTTDFSIPANLPARRRSL